MRFASAFLVAAPGREPARPGRGARAWHGPDTPHRGLWAGLGVRGAGSFAGWADWGVFGNGHAGWISEALFFFPKAREYCSAESSRGRERR